MLRRDVRVTVGGALGSIVCVVVLHVLRTDLSPMDHRMSEYATGPYAWLMVTAFAVLGVALIAFGRHLWSASARDRIKSISAGAALVAGAATLVSAMFPALGSPSSERIHSAASTTAVLAFLVLAISFTATRARVDAGAPKDRVAILLAAACVIAAAMGPVLHDSPWKGLSQRALWVVLLGWLLRVSLNPLER